MEIHQILVAASPGDAITNAALALRNLFRRIGNSDIYARHVHPSMATDVHQLNHYTRRLTARPQDDVLFYHAAIGEPEVCKFLHERSERLVLLYHNISPHEAFLDYDPAFAGMLEAGRRELEGLRNRTTLAMAVSEFNALDLEVMGYRRVRVAPLVVELDDLVATPPDPGVSHYLEQVITGPVVLFVGQLLPHKRPDAVIKAYHALTTYLRPDAHVILIGNPRLRRYFHALQAFAQELNLPKLWLTGSVTRERLVAFYRRADVFLTLSEHEGFCVPLLEAMSFRVPIVARSCAAIPETVADAALLLPKHDDSLLAAEVLSAVLEDTRCASDLTARGNERLKHYDPDRCRAMLLSHLESVL